MKSNYSQEYYKFLIEEYFTSIIQQNLYLHNLDIYQINEIGKWSLINEGREFKKSREFYNELKEKKEIVEKDGYKYTIYKLLDFDRANFDWSFGQYVELSYDFSILKKYYTRVQIFIVITALLIIVIFYSIFSFLFNKHFVKRVININEGIKRIEGENYEIPIIDEGTDELANIAKNINDMAKIIHQRIKILTGFIPICANCKKIKDDKGFWHQVEAYIQEHSEAVFSHGLCPDCMKKLYKDYADDDSTDEKSKDV